MRDNIRGRSMGINQSKKNVDLHNSEELAQDKRNKFHCCEEVLKLRRLIYGDLIPKIKDHDNKFNNLQKEVNEIKNNSDYNKNNGMPNKEINNDNSQYYIYQYEKKKINGIANIEMRNKNNHKDINGIPNGEIFYNQNFNKNENKKEDFVIDLINYYNNKFNGKSLKNFLITYYKIDELKYRYFTPSEIEKESNLINTYIQDKTYDYMPKKERILNETVGNFVYSIGGISRITQVIVDKLYNQLFEEYKKYLLEQKCNLNNNNEENRRNFSIWIKKCLKGNEIQSSNSSISDLIINNKIYEYYAYLNIKEIEIYLYKNDYRTNEILFKIFQSFICLYLKCLLSFPIVKLKYIGENSDYIPRDMIDDCNPLKGKNKKVNFCYIPALESNNKFLNKYYVFTFIKGKSFNKEGNLFNHSKITQKQNVYNSYNSNNNISSDLRKRNNMVY
jgi:hypothetical protein